MLRLLIAAVRRYWGHLALATACVLVLCAGLVVAVDADLAAVGLLLAAAVALLGLTLVERQTRAQRHNLRQSQDVIKDVIRRQEAFDGRIQRLTKEVTSSANRMQESIKAAAAEQKASEDRLLSLLSDMEGRRRLDEAMRVTERERFQKQILSGLRDAKPKLDTADVTALFSLFQVLPLDGPPTLPTDFTASPRTMQSLVTEVLSRPGPLSIVECGSGASTVWLAAACRRAGSGAVLALEHNERYAREATQALQLCGLSDYAEVRHAPLVSLSLDGQNFSWYDPTAYNDVRQIDLLFVDGPPGSTGPLARYPALPLLADALAPGALVVVDDIERSEEATVVQRWMDAQHFEQNLVEVSRAGRAALLRWNAQEGFE